MHLISLPRIHLLNKVANASNIAPICILTLSVLLLFRLVPFLLMISTMSGDVGSKMKLFSLFSVFCSGID